MTAAEQIQQWADVADRERRLALANLLAHEAVPAMAAALQAVLGVFSQDDPCPPRTCAHIDCEIVHVINEALGVES